MNNIILSGRLTKKPELKKTQSNKSVCEFSVAVNRGIKDEEDNYIVDFINCRVWNKLAENLCQYKDKGDYVIVQGKLYIDHYVDKDKNNRITTYVLVENIEFTPKQSTPQKQEKAIDNWDAGKNVEIDDDMLPFYN